MTSIDENRCWFFYPTGAAGLGDLSFSPSYRCLSHDEAIQDIITVKLLLIVDLTFQMLIKMFNE